MLSSFFEFPKLVVRNIKPLPQLCVCVCVCARARMRAACMCVGGCVCGNRINLLYDSEFHVSSQSSGRQFYFYLPKNKNSYIHLPYQNTKCDFPDFNPYYLLMTHFVSLIYSCVYTY